jgi:hypothetical protein
VTSARKTEPPLKLDMDFAEALERFARTKPEEVAESIERSKTKKPPGANVGRPSQKLPRSRSSPLRGKSQSGDD